MLEKECLRLTSIKGRELWSLLQYPFSYALSPKVASFPPALERGYISTRTSSNYQATWLVSATHSGETAVTIWFCTTFLGKQNPYDLAKSETDYNSVSELLVIHDFWKWVRFSLKGYWGKEPRNVEKQWHYEWSPSPSQPKADFSCLFPFCSFQCLSHL